MNTFMTVLELSSDGASCFIHDIEVDLELVTPSTPPSGQYGPPEFYDPGDGAEFEITEVRVFFSEDSDTEPLILDPDHFAMIFPRGQRLLNKAHRWAEEHEHDFL